MIQSQNRANLTLTQIQSHFNQCVMVRIKKCFKCGEKKSLSHFYKHNQMLDGHVNKCKDCNKKDVTENRNKNIEKVRAYDRKRGNRQTRRYAIEYREKNRKKINEKNRAYYSENKEKSREIKKRYVTKNKEKIKQKTKKYRKNNPEKQLAHQAVGYAVKTGKLKKQPCEICGSEKVHAHHEDYSKPLNVIWFCPEHHAEIHRNEK